MLEEEEEEGDRQAGAGLTEGGSEGRRVHVVAVGLSHGHGLVEGVRGDGGRRHRGVACRVIHKGLDAAGRITRLVIRMTISYSKKLLSLGRQMEESKKAPLEYTC